MSRLTEYREAVLQEPDEDSWFDDLTSGGGGGDRPFENLTDEQLIQAYYNGDVVNGVKVTEGRLIAEANARGKTDEQINRIIDNKPSGSTQAGTQANSNAIVAGALAGNYSIDNAVKQIAKAEGISDAQAQDRYNEIVASGTAYAGTARERPSAAMGRNITAAENERNTSYNAAGVGTDPSLYGSPGPYASGATTSYPPLLTPEGTGRGAASGQGAGGGGQQQGGGDAGGALGGPPLPSRQYDGASEKQLFTWAENGLIDTGELVDELEAMGKSRGYIDKAFREAGLSFTPGRGEELATLNPNVLPSTRGQEEDVPIYESRGDYSRSYGDRRQLTQVPGTSVDTTGLQLSGSIDGKAVGFGAGRGTGLDYVNAVQQARDITGATQGQEFGTVLAALIRSGRIPVPEGLSIRGYAQGGTQMLNEKTYMVGESGRLYGVAGEAGPEMMQFIPMDDDVMLGREGGASARPFGHMQQDGFRSYAHGGTAIASQPVYNDYGGLISPDGRSVTYPNPYGDDREPIVVPRDTTRRDLRDVSSRVSLPTQQADPYAEYYAKQLENLGARESDIQTLQNFYEPYYAQQTADVQAQDALAQQIQLAREGSLEQETALTTANMEAQLAEQQQLAGLEQGYRASEQQRLQELEAARGDPRLDYRFGMAGLPTAYDRAAASAAHERAMETLQLQADRAQVQLDAAERQHTYSQAIFALGQEEQARRLEDAALNQEIQARQALADIERSALERQISYEQQLRNIEEQEMGIGIQQANAGPSESDIIQGQINEVESEINRQERYGRPTYDLRKQLARLEQQLRYAA